MTARTLGVVSTTFRARALANPASLLDAVMPRYSVRAHRSTVVRAPAETVYRALTTTLQGAERHPFILLTRQPGRDLLLGAMGPLWRVMADRAQTPTAAAWCEYQPAGTARTATVVRIEPVDYQTSRIDTETRVETRGRGTGVLFRLYWAVLGRRSSLLPRRLLRRARVAAERETGLFILTP